MSVFYLFEWATSAKPQCSGELAGTVFKALLDPRFRWVWGGGGVAASEVWKGEKRHGGGAFKAWGLWLGAAWAQRQVVGGGSGSAGQQHRQGGRGRGRPPAKVGGGGGSCHAPLRPLCRDMIVHKHVVSATTARIVLMLPMAARPAFCPVLVRLSACLHTCLPPLPLRPPAAAT